MKKYPKDTPSRVIGETAESIIHYQFDKNTWSYVIESKDRGLDCHLELIEEGEYRNNRLDCQIKGTLSPKISFGKCISFALDVKTIGYALNSKSAFVLLVVDVSREKIYFVCLQDYFKKNEYRDNSSTQVIHIPLENTYPEKEEFLIELAKRHF